MVRYRAAPAEALRIVPLDALTLVYHRPAGATHLLAEPAPEMLAALSAGPASVDELADRLGTQFDLPDAAGAALVSHLDELVGSGLVERL